MFKSVYKPKFECYILGTLVKANALNYFAFPLRVELWIGLCRSGRFRLSRKAAAASSCRPGLRHG